MIKKNDVVYISGPMTGIENFNYPAFLAMEYFLLENFNCIILSPAKHPNGLSYEQYMVLDLAMVEICDVLLLLDGWHNSPGAQKERAKAVKMGKNIIKEKDLTTDYALHEGEQSENQYTEQEIEDKAQEILL